MKKLTKVLVLVLLVGCSLCTHIHTDTCVIDENGNCQHQCELKEERYEHKDPTQ